MRRSGLVVVAVVCLLVGIGATSWTRGIDPPVGKGVLAGVRVAQAVVLKDLGVVYEVRVPQEQFPTGEEVAEVGVDYLGVNSEAGVETRTPSPRPRRSCGQHPMTGRGGPQTWDRTQGVITVAQGKPPDRHR